jgi:hypothetical protein
MIDLPLAYKGLVLNELDHALAAEEASYDWANCVLTLRPA